MRSSAHYAKALPCITASSHQINNPVSIAHTAFITGIGFGMQF